MLANKANNKPGKKDERRKEAHVGKGYSFGKKHRRHTDSSGRLPGRGEMRGLLVMCKNSFHFGTRHFR